MDRRVLLSVANVAVAGAALVLWLRYPHDAYYALFLLFGWFAVSFSLSWSVRGAPATTGPASGPTSGSSPATPKPVTGAAGVAGPVARIPFCVYCATDLPEGAGRCPACGRMVPAFG